MSNLTLHKRDKLNRLLGSWPSGTVMTQSWFERQGITRQLSYFYVKSGWLEKIGQGAFIKTGDQVNWMGGLYAIQQQLDLKVHLGGRSLLEVKGASHFIPMGPKRPLYLYANEGSEVVLLPKWFIQAFSRSATITYFARKLFSTEVGMETLEQANFTIQVSSKERALMEVLSLVSKDVGYTHAYRLFQGQHTLRPSLVQELLENCVSYKVKRLFLYLGKKCSLPWIQHLNLSRITLGRGKRQIGSGGVYDPEFEISVPKLSPFDDPDFDPEV